MKTRRMSSTLFLSCLLAMVVVLSACAKPQPILYPNARLNFLGEAQGKRDIAYCELLAKEYGENRDQVSRVAKSGAWRGLLGGAGGAALGALGGAIAGNPGAGAAIGAAVGAAGGILSSLVEAGESNPTYRRFVEHCLRRHGYDPIGWSS